ncbi:MAG: hypothetical protein P8123_04845, partial [bacterium]
INYRILGHRNYIIFNDSNSFMDRIAAFEAKHHLWSFRPCTVLLGFGMVIALLLFYRWLLNTVMGLRLRAVGSRPYLVSYSRGPVGKYIIIGLILSNVTVGLGGWFSSSLNENANISVFGTILHALAAAIIGESIIEHLPRFKDRRTSVMTILLAPLVGATIYIFFRASVTWFIMEEIQGADPQNYRLSTQDANAVIASFIIVAIMALRFFSQKWKEPVLLNPDQER